MNGFVVFVDTFNDMKQELLERIGYTVKIGRLLGKGIVVALTGQGREVIGV